jgi:hypothetical protein
MLFSIVVIIKPNSDANYIINDQTRKKKQTRFEQIHATTHEKN